MKKITKRENFEKIIEVLRAEGEEELIKVMEHEIELLDKKKANGKMTKTQEENEGIKQVILKTLEEIGKPVSITNLIKDSEELGQFTNQKISALMSQLINKDKLVVRTQDKKTALFSLVEE